MSDEEDFNIVACKELEKILNDELKNKIEEILDIMVYRVDNLDRLSKIEALKLIMGSDNVNVLLHILKRTNLDFINECGELKNETKEYFIHLKAKYGVNLGIKLGNAYYNNPDGWMRISHIFSTYEPSENALWLRYKITKNNLTEYYLEDSMYGILSLIKAFTVSLNDSFEDIASIKKKLDIKQEINELVDAVNKFKTLYDPISI